MKSRCQRKAEAKQWSIEDVTKTNLVNIISWSYISTVTKYARNLNKNSFYCKYTTQEDPKAQKLPRRSLAMFVADDHSIEGGSVFGTRSS